MGFVGDIVSSITGSDSADAAKDASKLSAAGKQEAIDYLKEAEEIPHQFRDESLKKLGGLYGLEGGEGNMGQFINEAKESPLYKSILGSKKAGEDAITRNAAMTGGLRSGNIQEGLYDYNVQLKNAALLTSVNDMKGGLTGLSGLGDNSNAIAQLIADKGETLAQGKVGAAQAKQSGIGNLLGLGLTAASVFGYSDPRLKTDVKKTGTFRGFNWYTWTWSKEAEELGLSGKSEGLMADEVLMSLPGKVVITDSGYLAIQY